MVATGTHDIQGILQAQDMILQEISVTEDRDWIIGDFKVMTYVMERTAFLAEVCLSRELGRHKKGVRGSPPPDLFKGLFDALARALKIRLVCLQDLLVEEPDNRVAGDLRDYQQILESTLVSIQTAVRKRDLLEALEDFVDLVRTKQVHDDPSHTFRPFDEAFAGL